MQTVTVSVLTYNSSKFVLETLESIKNQTYPNLILHICDDCSTDNTIDICRKWIGKNKDRFESTDIIIPEHNTGVSANCNRAWDACTTEYQKEIAGDDVLLPNCIEDNMKYVKEHPDAAIVFSRMKSFGASVEECNHTDGFVYVYDFFSWTPEKQYDFLYNDRNCIPAPSCFVNINILRKINLRHDERIPMQEDVAKWLNALRLRIKLHFFDKTTVKYRIHEASLSTAEITRPISRRSQMLYWYYYKFTELYSENPDNAIKQAVDKYMYVYQTYYEELYNGRNSVTYKTGNFIVYPIRNLIVFLKRFFYKKSDS